MTAPPTIQFASFAYGEGPALDDPAEAFHEAARLRPGVSPRLPELSAPLVASMRRSSRRHPHRPRVPLPVGRASHTALGRALARRRSVAPRPGSRLRLDDVGALARAYCWDAAHERRAVPSAGGLYPLELYVVARRVAGLTAGVYHVDPCEPSLELLWPGPQSLAGILLPPAPDPAALLVITSVFWRTRCKYGVRGYRFALLEAGHLGQALVLLGAARRLDALPLGGFFDPGLDELVGADGVDESVVYAVAVGRGGR